MAATQTAAERNNFALLDDYAQERLCRGTASAKTAPPSGERSSGRHEKWRQENAE